METAALRDPNAYVTALVDLQRCERQLGLLLSTKRQAQDTKLLKRGLRDATEFFSVLFVAFKQPV